MNTKPQSLVDQLVGSVALPRLALALAVAGLLVVLLFVAVFAQGGVPVGGRWGLWKMGLEPAVILCWTASMEVHQDSLHHSCAHMSAPGAKYVKSIAYEHYSP